MLCCGRAVSKLPGTGGNGKQEVLEVPVCPQLVPCQQPRAGPCHSPSTQPGSGHPSERYGAGTCTGPGSPLPERQDERHQLSVFLCFASVCGEHRLGCTSRLAPSIPLTPGAAGAHLGSPAWVFFRHGNTVWVWLISAHPETLPVAVPSFLWCPQRWSPRLGDKWCWRSEWPWGLLSPPERSRRPGHVSGQSVVVLRAALCSQAVPAALATRSHRSASCSTSEPFVLPGSRGGCAGQGPCAPSSGPQGFGGAPGARLPAGLARLVLLSGEMFRR